MAKINMYSGKSLTWKRYQNSPVMKKLLANPKIAAALDKPGERFEFFRDLQNAGNGGVTKNNVKEMLGKYMTGKGRTISRKEASIIAGEIFKGDSRKYISPKNNPAKNDASTNRASSPNQATNFAAAQTMFSVPRTVLTNGGRMSDVGGEKAPGLLNGLSKDEKKGDKGSFSRALAAVRRNKGK
jgi:hypothetical protein